LKYNPEDERVDEEKQERVEKGPEEAQGRCLVATLDFTHRELKDQIAVAPQAAGEAQGIQVVPHAFRPGGNQRRH
jgi:hypothetical protein